MLTYTEKAESARRIYQQLQLLGAILEHLRKSGLPYNYEAQSALRILRMSYRRLSAFSKAREVQTKLSERPESAWSDLQLMLGGKASGKNFITALKDWTRRHRATLEPFEKQTKVLEMVDRLIPQIENFLAESK